MRCPSFSWHWPNWKSALAATAFDFPGDDKIVWYASMAPFRSPTTISRWMAASNCHSASAAEDRGACGGWPSSVPAHTNTAIANGSLNRLHLALSIRKHSQNPALKVSDLGNIPLLIMTTEFSGTN